MNSLQYNMDEARKCLKHARWFLIGKNNFQDKRRFNGAKYWLDRTSNWLDSCIKQSIGSVDHNE